MDTKKRTPKSLASVVLSARVKRHWTQMDLANAASVSPSLIANIERGVTATATPLTLAKIGEALGKDLSRFAK